jgi:mannose-1-phosphate guanylyltransferase
MTGRSLWIRARASRTSFRDKDDREVDFVVIERRKPVLMVECKLGDDDVGRGLQALHERFPDCPAWQVHAQGKKDYLSTSGVRVAPALELLRALA